MVHRFTTLNNVFALFIIRVFTIILWHSFCVQLLTAIAEILLKIETNNQPEMNNFIPLHPKKKKKQLQDLRAKLKLSHITSCQPRAERQKLWAECEVQSLINQQVLPCPSFRQTCQLLCRNTSQSLQQVGLWNNFSLGKCTFYKYVV